MDVGGGELSGNVGLVSNYLWRGVTQSDDGAALQGGVDWVHDSGLYLGTWASRVDFGDAASYEVDLYAGWDFDNWLPRSFSLGVTAVYYAYPDSDPDDYDVFELGTSVGWKWLSAGLQVVAWSDFSEEDPYAEGDCYVFGRAQIPLPRAFELEAQAGYQQFQSSDSYTHWRVSLSRDVGKLGTFSIGYEQNTGDEDDDVATDNDPKLWVGWQWPPSGE